MPGQMQRRTRHRTYFLLMGTCVVLILLAWNVVRLWSTTAAVVMSVVAALIPPVAAFVGNQGALDESAPPTLDETTDADD
jgi:Protein of unknown function (DUF3099)